MVRRLYEMKEQPPMGEVPEQMYAWTVRKERYGEPREAWHLEVVDVPMLGEYDVLVYVMAAGVNYNNVWAGLGVPLDVIATKRASPKHFTSGEAMRRGSYIGWDRR
jgi:crotonyl-CoA carboxylase/reductase